MSKQAKIIIAGGAALLAAIVTFYPRGEEPLPHDFGVIEFIPDAPDAPRDSEWLALAKYDLLTRDPAPTVEDAVAYALFAQKYSKSRILQITGDDAQVLEHCE